MARPADPQSPYRVSIHTTKGYRYASTQPSFVDPQTGRRRHRQYHWGTVDENNRFHPGSRYLLASPEERARLVFPADWDLSEIEKPGVPARPARPAPAAPRQSLLCGDTWLLGKIADAQGIAADLEAALGGGSRTDALLTVAFHLLCGWGSLERLSAWQHIARAPCRELLVPGRLDRLFGSVTEENGLDFARRRMARCDGAPLCAVATFGHAVPGDAPAPGCSVLPPVPVLDLVAYAAGNYLPVWQRGLPGAIPDSRGLALATGALDAACPGHVPLVTDCGRLTLRNLDAFLVRDRPLVMGLDIAQPDIMNRIKEFDTRSLHAERKELYPDTQIYHAVHDLEYRPAGGTGKGRKARNLKLHLYFDPLRRSRDLLAVEAALEAQLRALEAARKERCPVDDEATLKRAYWCCKVEVEDGSRLVKGFAPNAKKLARRRAGAGFLAVATQGVADDAGEVLRLWQLFGEQGRWFAAMRSRMSFGTGRGLSGAGRAGRQLALFVARLLACHLEAVRRGRLAGWPSAVALLDALRPVRHEAAPGRKGRMTPFTPQQAAICDAFGIEVPAGCAPGKVVDRQKDPLETE